MLQNQLRLFEMPSGVRLPSLPLQHIQVRTARTRAKEAPDQATNKARPLSQPLFLASQALFA